MEIWSKLFILHRGKSKEETCNSFLISTPFLSDLEAEATGPLTDVVPKGPKS